MTCASIWQIEQLYWYRPPYFALVTIQFLKENPVIAIVLVTGEPRFSIAYGKQEYQLYQSEHFEMFPPLLLFSEQRENGAMNYWDTVMTSGPCIGDMPCLSY